MTTPDPTFGPKVGLAPATPALTPRQTQVAHLLVQGLSNKQIARRLGVTDHTVAAHLSHIYQKTGKSDRVSAAITLLYHLGIATPCPTLEAPQCQP